MSFLCESHAQLILSLPVALSWVKNPRTEVILTRVLKISQVELSSKYLLEERHLLSRYKKSTLHERVNSHTVFQLFVKWARLNRILFVNSATSYVHSVRSIYRTTGRLERVKNYTQEVGVMEIRGSRGVGHKQPLSSAFNSMFTKSRNNLLDCSFFIYGGLIFLSKPRYLNR